MFEPTLTNVIAFAIVSAFVCLTFVLITLRSRGEDRRISKRFDINCEVEFTANGTNYRGITQDLSLTGLAIKTEHQFGPDTILDIVIKLPGDKTSKLKGQVVRTIQNGVGVKIIGNNSDYMHFYKNLQGME